MGIQYTILIHSLLAVILRWHHFHSIIRENLIFDDCDDFVKNLKCAQQVPISKVIIMIKPSEYTSVSGLGIKTGSFMVNLVFLKSHSSIMYWTGILK